MVVELVLHSIEVHRYQIGYNALRFLHPRDLIFFLRHRMEPFRILVHSLMSSVVREHRIFDSLYLFHLLTDVS